MGVHELIKKAIDFGLSVQVANSGNVDTINKLAKEAVEANRVEKAAKLFLQLNKAEIKAARKLDFKAGYKKCHDNISSDTPYSENDFETHYNQKC